MRSLLLLVSIILAGQANAANDLDAMQLAMNLGNLLASEDACGLTYDHAAIEKFIDDKVAADDLEFASNLSMMTDGAAFQIGQMTAAAKAAHCRQISRVAKSFGFTD